jgi:phosphate:Na+ symporter
MIQDIKLWAFLAGLGLFLLGMFMLEQGLRGLGSSAMKRFLRDQTSSPLRGVLTGTLVTAFLQSSSLVGLIILAFVGAGMLELRNAFGIIIGSNLGTTFTGWVVALIGFKLNLVDYAQPLLATGAFCTVFLTRDTRPYFYGNLLLGLGLLLMGLSEMTGGFASLTEAVDVSFFHGHNLFFYFFAGAIFTAIIQSSSAAMMIVLSALHAEVFSLQEAAPIIIGADLGTTSTVLLGALKATTEKKRVAMSHLFYNLITSSLALLLVPAYLYFITIVLGMTDPLLSVVAFHSLFNIVGITVFMPFIDRFIQFLAWLIPDSKKTDGSMCLYIRRVSVDVAEAATEAVRKELSALIFHAIKLNLHCFKVKQHHVYPQDFTYSDDVHLDFEHDYALLKRSAGEVLGYTYMVQSKTNDEKSLNKLTQLNHAVRNVSYAAKFIKDIRHNLMDFRHSSSTTVNALQNGFKNEVELMYRKLILLLINNNPELTNEKFIELKTYLRQGYEKFIQEIYSGSGQDVIDDMETSSLLNVNRAFYLSCSALLESTRILLAIPETTLSSDMPILTEQ